MKEKLLWCSLILFALSIILFVIDYFIFHHLGEDSKFHKEFSKKAQKPFVASLFGQFAVLMLSSSVVTLVLALVAF